MNQNNMKRANPPASAPGGAFMPTEFKQHSKRKTKA